MGKYPDKYKWQKLTKEQAWQLLGLYVAGSTARAAAAVMGINKNTATTWFRRWREIVAEHEDKAPLEGTVEVDESYFGGRKRKGPRGRGAAGKVIVLGMLERETGRILAAPINNVSGETLRGEIAARVAEGSDIKTDQWRGYTGLTSDGYGHETVNHKKGEYARPGGRHTNGIENFWKQAKRHLNRFNGGWKPRARDWLAECALRFQAGILGFRELLVEWTREANSAPAL